jgi:multiple sugar transport system substrate-binding protein
VDEFDLLVIDHPFVGRAAARGLLLPLDQHLPDAQPSVLSSASVGPSALSYVYAGHVWALAIDAAAQVSSYRPDAFTAMGLLPASTWVEVLRLAGDLGRRNTRMALPLNKTDIVPSLYSLCASLGTPAFEVPGHVLSPSRGVMVLELLVALAEASDPESRDWDPPRTLDALADGHGPVYSPMLFGYSNYSRAGAYPHPVRFADLPSADGRPHGSCLGGAGLAVSARSEHAAAATAYAAWLASGEVQRAGYAGGGGQPGHRSAWLDTSLDAGCGRFFSDTLATMDAAWVRPRFDGYHGFQIEAGEILTEWLAAPARAPLRVMHALDEALARHWRG